MEWAKFVAYEQNVIVSLIKNLLWNVRHGSIDVLFNHQSNVFSLYWIQFLSKTTKKVKLWKSLSRLNTRIEISRSTFQFNSFKLVFPKNITFFLLLNVISLNWINIFNINIKWCLKLLKVISYYCSIDRILCLKDIMSVEIVLLSMCP